MKFKFSQRSMARIETVDDKVQALCHLALDRSPIDFAIVQGRRTQDEQMRLYGKGRTAAECMKAGVPTAYAKPKEQKVTWTLKSNHLSGRAVDFAPIVDGKIFMPDRPTAADIAIYKQVADAFKSAAAELGITIQWGGDWTRTKDFPHIEMEA
jgi:peptidoglycan LD-endopeptidase CwlK